MAKRDLGAPGGRVARRDDLDRDVRQACLQVSGECDGPGTDRRHPDLVEDGERGRDRGERDDRRRRGRPAGSALGGHERSLGVEAHVRIESPPAAQTRDRCVARVAFVDEDRADRARAAVQVLVGAPGGEVDVPVVERELDVPGGVRQVPADDGARFVAGGGEPLDLERLPGREVDAAQEDECEVVRLHGDGRLEVLDPDQVLTVARADDDEVRSRVQPALREMGRQGVAVGREERSVGEDPSAPAIGPEERGEQQVDVDGEAVEQRDLARERPDDPCHRPAQGRVQREPWTARVEPGVDALARPGVQFGRDRRGRGPRLQAERLPRQVDRGRAVWSGRDVEPVTHPGRQRFGRVACWRVVVGHGPVSAVGRSRERRVAFGDAWTSIRAACRPRSDLPDRLPACRVQRVWCRFTVRGNVLGPARVRGRDHDCVRAPRQPRRRSRPRSPRPRSLPKAPPPDRSAPTPPASRRSGSPPGCSRWAPTPRRSRPSRRSHRPTGSRRNSRVSNRPTR